MTEQELYELLASDVDDITKVDRIEQFIVNSVEQYTFGYTGPMWSTNGLSWQGYLSKMGVESRAALFLARQVHPHYNAFGYIPNGLEATGRYYWDYHSLYSEHEQCLGSDALRSKYCKDIFTWVHEPSGKEECSANMQVPDRIAQKVYDYWTYLVDNEYTYNKQEQEKLLLRQKLTKKYNRDVYLQRAMSARQKEILL